MGRMVWATLRDTRGQSHAECLLRIGRLATFFIRHGATVAEAADALGLGVNVCRLALALYHSLDGMKLRALIEGWDMLTILGKLRDPGSQPRTRSCSKTTRTIHEAVRPLIMPRESQRKPLTLNVTAT